MFKIALEGMRFYAYHGFYAEEQVVGNEYQVDVYLETSVQKHARDAFIPEDDIQTTISYETIYHICKLEMKKPVRLLETLAQRILKKIKGQYKDQQQEMEDSQDYHVVLQSVTVRVSKFNPPLGGRVERAYVEVSG